MFKTLATATADRIEVRTASDRVMSGRTVDTTKRHRPAIVKVGISALPLCPKAARRLQRGHKPDGYFDFVDRRS